MFSYFMQFLDCKGTSKLKTALDDDFDCFDLIYYTCITHELLIILRQLEEVSWTSVLFIYVRQTLILVIVHVNSQHGAYPQKIS